MRYTYCYKTRQPVIYNKGTKWETSCSMFLMSYAGDLSEAMAYVRQLNIEHPERFWNGQRIDWEHIDYFFVGEQEMFDTSGT